jgi:hypothetical protein
MQLNIELIGYIFILVKIREQQVKWALHEDLHDFLCALRAQFVEHS